MNMVLAMWLLGDFKIPSVLRSCQYFTLLFFSYIEKWVEGQTVMDVIKNRNVWTSCFKGC